MKTLINFNHKSNERLDVFLTYYTKLARSYIKEIIQQGLVEVSGKIITKPSFILKEDQTILCDFENYFNSPKFKLIPWEKSNIINVIDETKDFIILNKPSGIVVHPAVGNWENTLANALIAEKSNLDFSDKSRPGIVHRLDKMTSGVIIISKNIDFTNSIQEQFKTKRVVKNYLAFVEGKVKAKEGQIIAPIGKEINSLKMKINGLHPKEAITNFKVLKVYENYSLLMFYPQTGRTHQIRVHAKFMGHPILNDPLYSDNNNLELLKEYTNFGQFLHAYKITFTNLENEIVSYKAEIPKEFQQIDKYINALLEAEEQNEKRN